MRKILEMCPSCEGPLEITEVACLRCGTRVQAHYRPCDFCRLTDEQSTFLRTFLTSRGNLSDVEKRLGVSYPTVRAKLDEVIGRLQSDDAMEGTTGTTGTTGTAVAAPPPPRQAARSQAGPSGAPDRRAILDAIARGALSAPEGLERLRGATLTTPPASRDSTPSPDRGATLTPDP